MTVDLSNNEWPIYGNNGSFLDRYENVGEEDPGTLYFVCTQYTVGSGTEIKDQILITMTSTEDPPKGKVAIVGR